MSFTLNNVPKGPAFGPSPTSSCRPYDMPYTPFNKQDKLCRIADWISADDAPTYGQGGRPGQQQHQRAGQQQQQQSQRGGRQAGGGRNAPDAGADGAFGFKQEYDEASFATVSASGRTAAVVAPSASLLAARGGLSAMGGGRGGRGGAGAGGRGGRGGASAGGARAPLSNARPAGVSSGRPAGSSGGFRGGRGGYAGNFVPRVVRDASVNVQPEWSVVGELDLPRIYKHGAMDSIPEPELISMYGSVGTYSKVFDRVSTKNEMALAVSDRSNAKSSSPSTLEDPVLIELVETSAAGGLDKPTIFATDAILSQIMMAPRAVYSWDLVVTRLGEHVIVLDKRPGELDLASVNENANETPQDHPTDKEHPNNPGNIAIEATYINANYSQQVVDHDKRVSLGGEPPILQGVADEEKPSAAYMYKKYSFEDYMDVIVRTEVDAVTEMPGGKGGATAMATVRALNQVPGLPGNTGDWRKALDSQRGAVMATEMRNNTYKLARWITQALLAETDVLKVGFVARAAPRDVSRHTILGVTTYKPQEFATQMNLSMTQGFGVVYALMEAAVQQPPGKYVLLKDPNRQFLKLYQIPMEPLAPEFVVGPSDPFADCVPEVEEEHDGSDLDD
ncbi:eukaryotic translation initiation factor 3 subunit D [Catenaria anguillulae PL171]|uniref:Eukaryotic translation initiation factor 3 subunit D n=1 Tax=Catenaria anguillulae PL171 TaxID=765915 RepID=A0A1Y2HFY9_9FUNG|nr:eukaryotic translation initiation factor 3 subunit D [Catenaria anguillulae PL171]